MLALHWSLDGDKLEAVSAVLIHLSSDVTLGDRLLIDANNVVIRPCCVPKEPSGPSIFDDDLRIPLSYCITV